MNHQHKEKTVPVPHRIMNKTSIYLAHQVKVDRTDFLGYEAVVPLENDQSITIHSGANLTAKDGRVFDYVLSQWFATKKTQPEMLEMEVDVPSILEAMGQKNRTENRNKLITNLKRVIGTTIIYKWEDGEILFHLLDSVRIIQDTNIIAIRISNTYEKTLSLARKRYINVSWTMNLKSTYAIELSKLLQAKGSGVTFNGEPKPPKEIAHTEICIYLHLDPGSKTSKDEVRRAFNELKKVGYPTYGLRNCLWRNLDHTKNISKEK